MAQIPVSILQNLEASESRHKVRAIREKICDAYFKAGFRYNPNGCPGLEDLEPLPEVNENPRDCNCPWHPGCSICKPDSETREQESKERIYGFTLTVPVEKKDSAKSICEASLHKIRKSKAFNITKWYGCFELTKKEVFHAHVIFAVDKSEGKYPRKENLAKMHPYGFKWEERPKKSWLAWHRYIRGAGKVKFGFFGEPFMDDSREEPVMGAPFGPEASPPDAP